MNKRAAERFRRPLQELLARLRPDVAEMTAQTLAPSGGQAGGELTNSPMHLADKGTEEFLHGITAVLLQNEERIIEQARDALARIDAGTFGICALSSQFFEKPIMGFKRYFANPNQKMPTEPHAIQTASEKPLLTGQFPMGQES